MPAFKFISKHDFEGPHVYAATNESWETLKKSVQKAATQPFTLSGGISSGGDVPIILLAPVSEQVVAIDHSKRSLAWAMLKALMLERWGAAKTHQVLQMADWERSCKFGEAVSEFLAELPADLNTSHSEFHSCLAKVYKSITEEELALAAANLHKITFIHGDIMDLVDHGPFDFLYLSNAVESGHSSRDGVVPKFESIEPLVKSKGYVLGNGNFTYGIQYKNTKLANWTHLPISHQHPLLIQKH